MTDGRDLLIATKDFCATVPRKGSTAIVQLTDRAGIRVESVVEGGRDEVQDVYKTRGCP